MKRFASLKDARNFIRVFKNGRALRGQYFRLHYLRNEVEKLRIGIVVTRKAGSSVTRNLLRRRYRNILCKSFVVLKFNYDIVIYVNSPINEIPFKDLEIEMNRLLDMVEGGIRV